MKPSTACCRLWERVDAHTAVVYVRSQDSAYFPRVPFPRSSGSWRGLHFSPDKVTEQEKTQRGGRRCGAPGESEVRLLSGPAMAVEPARLERRWMVSSANVRLVFVLKLTERLHLEQMCLSSDLVVGNVYRSRQERASTTARLCPLVPCLTIVQH